MMEFSECYRLQMGSTFALNAQKLDHCFTITIFILRCYKASQILKADSFTQTKVLMVSKMIVVHFLLLLYTTSRKTLNVPYQSLQVLREVEQKCLSSSLVIKAYPLKTYLTKPLARKDVSCDERVLNYTLSRARRYTECAFGIRAAKWRLLNKAT